MGYKDKDKQREANRRASQRRRDKVKGMTDVEIMQGMMESNLSTSVIPDQQLYDDWQEDMSSLPMNVVKPRWKPGVEPKMWQEGREYFETIVRLLVLTVAELRERGQWIPSWKYKQEGLLL